MYLGVSKVGQVNKPRRKMALLLPGHNEELIIATTIKSAIASGQNKRDIFVVNDASTDATRSIAESLLGKANVLNVKRSGKALAVQKAIKKFEIEKQYQWLHVADADSIFSPNYFKIYRRSLNPEYAVAVGFVQSLRGNWISTYRSLTYTYSQHFNRRIQSYFNMIAVLPGPITAFRTDILGQLSTDETSLTEDFDISVQIYRKNLGKIKFIPSAVNYTQDPQNLRDFYQQNLRWQRGFFQGVKKYKIGVGRQRIDLSLGFQMLQTILLFVELLVVLPIQLALTHNYKIVAVAIAADFVVNGLIAIGCSVATKRWNLIGSLPYFYFLRWLEVSIYVRAFVEVIVLQRFKSKTMGWSTEGRRYKLGIDALRDTARVKTA